MADPIFYYSGDEPMSIDASYTTTAPGWYFWTETWADIEGPYPTREIAEEKVKEYCRVVLGK